MSAQRSLSSTHIGKVDQFILSCEERKDSISGTKLLEPRQRSSFTPYGGWEYDIRRDLTMSGEICQEGKGVGKNINTTGIHI